MTKLFRALCALCVAGFGGDAWGLDAIHYTVQVTADVQSSPPQIALRWPSDEYARNYVVRRKRAEDGGWSAPLATLDATATEFIDRNVALGQAWEYEIEENTHYFPYPEGDPAKWIRAYGYIYAGLEAPLVDNRGKIILLVDQTHAAALANELTRLEQDLVGDGWSVVRHDVSVGETVINVRNLIRTDYYADPANVKSVFLLGHLPVPYSGLLNPDMHDGHLGAWPADVFYGEMDGNWTDSSVTKTNSEYPANDNTPGDGKFDQSDIPSGVDLEVGRVDLSSLPAFGPRTEVELLRNYLNKDHNFRHKLTQVDSRALVRDNFGDIDGDAPAVDAWRNFVPFFGRGGATEVGPGGFFPALSAGGYLWAYGCGGGAYDKADGVGSTDDFALNDPKAVFYILHGSYFGDWDNENNFLRAPLATPTYGLVSVWAGLPHWYLHQMALGATIGSATRLTANNWNGLYKSYLNFSPGQVHIGLMGDPALRLQVVAPPSGLSAQTASGVSLSWIPSPEPVAGYHVYQASSPSGPFQRLTTSLLANPSFAPGAGSAGVCFYMVRAVKREFGPSGSYYNPSQGIVLRVEAGSTGGGNNVVTVDATDGDAGENGDDTGTILIRRAGDFASPLTVNFTLGGSAANGVDYNLLANQVTIPPGADAFEITVRAIPDTSVEGDETVILTLGAGVGYTLGSPASATVVIREAPAAPVANPDSAVTFANKPVAIEAGALLANDAGTGANDTLTLTAVGAVSNHGGKASLNGGTVTYTPPDGFTGTDSFAYTMQNKAGATAQGAVNVQVFPAARITSVARERGGKILLRFAGLPGRAYRLECSADAKTWKELATGTGDGQGTGEYLDVEAAAFPFRMYRVEWP